VPAEQYDLTFVDERQMTPALDAAIRALLCECHPDLVEPLSRSRYWHGSVQAYSFCYQEGDRVLGHVGVVLREIRCDGRPVMIAGVQNLAVTPRLRGKGLSRQLMREAAAEAARRKIRFGMLFCVPGLERFYNSLDWFRIEARVTMRDETGQPAPIIDENITMVTELARRPCGGLPGERFVAQEMDLQGPDW